MNKRPLFFQFGRYGGVAFGSALSDWIVFGALSWLGVYYIYAQMVSRCAGGLFSFLMNKHWSFKHRQGSYVVEGRRFLLLYLFSYCLSLMILYLAKEFASLSSPISKLLADSVCLFVNFLMMRYYVFHKRLGIIDRVSRFVRI